MFLNCKPQESHQQPKMFWKSVCNLSTYCGQNGRYAAYSIFRHCFCMKIIVLILKFHLNFISNYPIVTTPVLTEIKYEYWPSIKRQAIIWTYGLINWYKCVPLGIGELKHIRKYNGGLRDTYAHIRCTIFHRNYTDLVAMGWSLTNP